MITRTTSLVCAVGLIAAAYPLTADAEAPDLPNGSAAQQQETAPVFRKAPLTVTGIGKTFKPDPAKTVIAQDRFDIGGTTSTRNIDSVNLVWKKQGYFRRNRDLGQVFMPEQDFSLDALVLKTGPSDKAVVRGMHGATVFVQFLKITGTPVINDNGTPPGTKATHGFTDNHRADDFIQGITYEPLPVIYEGIFPNTIPVTYSDGKLIGDEGKNYYMRWHFPEAPVFEKGVRYGFMVGIAEPGKERRFTLANKNAASDGRPASLDQNPYPGGWAMRREGNGTIPPTAYPGAVPPEDTEQLRTLHGESLLPAGDKRFRQVPSTDGYPDVDTYRGFEFYMEGTVR